jgi:hypothetical protein
MQQQRAKVSSGVVTNQTKNTVCSTSVERDRLLKLFKIFIEVDQRSNKNGKKDNK